MIESPCYSCWASRMAKIQRYSKLKKKEHYYCVLGQGRKATVDVTLQPK